VLATVVPHQSVNGISGASRIGLLDVQIPVWLFGNLKFLSGSANTQLLKICLSGLRIYPGSNWAIPFTVGNSIFVIQYYKYKYFKYLG